MNDTELTQRMRELGIDVTRSTEILDRLNAGGYDHVEPVSVSGIPEVDNRTVIDRISEAPLRIAASDFRERLAAVAPEINPGALGAADGSEVILDAAALRALGIALYPRTCYGVLNGGSASSYADEKKNRSFDEELFQLFGEEFATLQSQLKGRPKGITPAYVNPDGTPGASFLELKFRMVLRHIALHRRLRADQPHIFRSPAPLTPLLPVLEMTSLFTEEAIREAYAGYHESPLVRDLDEAQAALDTRHAPQPLLAAFTHSSEGRPRAFFDRAWGKAGEPLGLPGGHGQNFHVLAEHYRALQRSGKRFVYLGNVDNVGFTVDPIGIARLALSGAPGAFDFAFRTAVDVKGGVLVYDQHDRLNCADIGAAIPWDDVLAAEESGKQILFNCATGLFSLDWLVGHLDRVIDDLPMRISDQDKDAGRYSQAEQVTWEIIAMMEAPLIFGIDRYRRFLPAKMLIDTLLTSGLHADAARQIQPAAERLAKGLSRVLEQEYAMRLFQNRWVPKESLD